MTLQGYEDNLLTLPGYQRFASAGAAAKLRQLVATGETFTVARDRICSQRPYFEPLNAAGQYTNFSTLSGP